MVKFAFYKNYSGSSMANGFEETKPQEERKIKRLLTIATIHWAVMCYHKAKSFVCITSLIIIKILYRAYSSFYQ